MMIKDDKEKMVEDKGQNFSRKNVINLLLNNYIVNKLPAINKIRSVVIKSELIDFLGNRKYEDDRHNRCFTLLRCIILCIGVFIW